MTSRLVQSVGAPLWQRRRISRRLTGILASVVCVTVVLVPGVVSASAEVPVVKGGLGIDYIDAKCRRPHGAWAAACKDLRKPAGSVALSSRRVAAGFNRGATWSQCGQLGGRWVVGLHLNRRFVPAATYARDFVEAARLLPPAMRRRADRQASFYAALAAQHRMRCGALHFTFRHAVGLALDEATPSPKVIPKPHGLLKSLRSDAVSTATAQGGWSDLNDVSPTGAYSDAADSGGAYISASYAAPNGEVFLRFSDPVSLNGPIADPTPEQLCYMAAVDETSGTPTCIADGTVIPDWFQASPPVQFDASGAAYFPMLVSDPLPTDDLAKYAHGQLTDVSSSSGQSLGIIGQSAPWVVLPDGSVVLDNGPVWLLTPDSSGVTYSGTEIAQNDFTGGNGLWKFPDGNAYVTNVDVGGAPCTLGQVSSSTATINPGYCVGGDPAADGPITQALSTGNRDLTPKALSLTSGQQWVVGDGEAAELYPSVQSVPLPSTIAADPRPQSFTADDKVLVIAHPATSSTADYVYSLDPNTSTWTELIGPGTDFAGQPGVQALEDGTTVYGAAFDPTDDAIILDGVYSSDRPWAVAVNLTTEAISPIIDSASAPTDHNYLWYTGASEYDSTTDQLSVAGLFAGPGPVTFQALVESINVRTGAVAQWWRHDEHDNDSVNFAAISSSVTVFRG